jgi:predicted RNA-binding Zn-ribbon protein involved in translation (DUF1610 family)
MNKYQEALNKFKCIGEKDIWNDHHLEWADTLQELVDKATPKKLKSKTDKDGRLLWVCPTCGDVYMKFWSDVETISCRKHCDECGQA